MSHQKGLKRLIDFCYTFSQLTIVPRIPKISDGDVSVESYALRGLPLKAPFIASPMDTVTDASVAIRLAQLGALAILYYNYPDPGLQLEELRKVKGGAVADGATTLGGRPAVGALLKVNFDVFPHVEKLVESGVDFVAVDSLHSAPELHLPFIRGLKKAFPSLRVMSGNVVHPDDCLAVIGEGVDSVRVGYSAASINRGWEILGTGRSQVKSIYECARVCKKHGVPLVADGGIKTTGDVAIAFALGADCLMMGKMFAACADTPGQFRHDEAGARVKVYKGMSRDGLLERGMVPEGSELDVPSREDLGQLINRLVTRLKMSVARGGTTSLEDFYQCATLEMVQHLDVP